MKSHKINAILFSGIAVIGIILILGSRSTAFIIAGWVLLFIGVFTARYFITRLRHRNPYQGVIGTLAQKGQRVMTEQEKKESNHGKTK